jgi:TatD DNase family protein
MAELIDTHCHLDYLSSEELQSVLGQLDINDVQKVITIGVSPENQSVIASLAERDSRIYFTQGLHPHHANQFSQAFLDDISSRVKNAKCVAIGEIGLDYHYMHSTKEQQFLAFEAQIDFAIQNQLPICIHTREAEEDTIAILKQFTKQLQGKVLIHSFTGTTKLSNFVLENNYLLSVNGIITFKNAKNIIEIIESFPLENILLETDSPYLAPVPHRGRTNTSLFLKHVFDGLVKIKKIDFSESKKIILDTTNKFFTF